MGDRLSTRADLSQEHGKKTASLTLRILRVARASDGILRENSQTSKYTREPLQQIRQAWLAQHNRTAASTEIP